jgi:GNAT superfamily N-acetyltransferase
MGNRLSQILAHPEYATFVAQAGADVVGLVGASLSFYYEQNGVNGRILVLVVDEEFRGRGVGAALLEAAEGWLSERGAATAILTSRHQRVDAHRFYQRQGYTNTGIRLVKPLSNFRI